MCVIHVGMQPKRNLNCGILDLFNKDEGVENVGQSPQS